MVSWNIVEVAAELRERAEASGCTVLDLSAGTPTLPTPQVVQQALAAAADAPGYPATHGSAALRQAYADWAGRAFAAALDPELVLPTIGSKELIAGLPALLGLGRDDLVVVPELSYPTYRLGAQRAGCRILAADSLTALGPQRPRLVWLNTPGNPTGRVLGVPHLRKVLQWARDRKALVASDECYLELQPPGQRPVSILDPEVNDGELGNLLAVHSLSKRSAMAGYRVGFVSGDPSVVADLLALRRSLGLIVPGPIQAAATAALNDDAHVADAAAHYDRHRQVLRQALEAGGFRVDDSTAGLFVWASNGEEDVLVTRRLAEKGLVVAPGGFYGPTGAAHIRVALTANTSDTLAAADILRHFGD